MLQSKTPQHLRIFIIGSSLDVIERLVIHVLLVSQAHAIAQTWEKNTRRKE